MGRFKTTHATRTTAVAMTIALAAQISASDGQTQRQIDRAQDNHVRAIDRSQTNRNAAPAVGSSSSTSGIAGDNGECAPQWLSTFGGAPGTNDEIQALAVFDDGSDPALYVGGFFNRIGGVDAISIAKWDGEAWASVGGGMEEDGGVRAMVVFDDGTGPALYVGGSFTTAGGVDANRIAKWDGSSWSALGAGISGLANPSVGALAVFDDGGGEALYVGGTFTMAGNVSASRIAKWNGSSWFAMGDGTNNWV